MTLSQQLLGILAYGSLIDEPGDELAGHITRIVRNITSPVAVEFARKSLSRGNGPTLVPYADGAYVKSAILLLDCSIREATDMLWRRETRTLDTGRGYPGARVDQPNAVRIAIFSNTLGCETLLYTSIAANIEPLDPNHLAALAIASVGKAKLGLDGISYLITARANGIVTKLSQDYEAAILQQTGTASLEQAREKLGGRSLD